MDIRKRDRTHSNPDFVIDFNHMVKLFSMFFLCISLSACVKLALRSTPSFIPRLSQAFFEECDPELSKQSLPSSLKIMEGLLKNDPENRQILTALCTGFAGYAMLFVEDEDPDRASLLYLRARNYGFNALGKKAPVSNKSKLTKDVVQDRINSIGKGDLEALFWSTMAWNAWINLNLDKPAALGQLSAAQACLKRVLEINPDYYHGAPYILMGSTLAAMPGPLGGDEQQAKRYFEKALQVSDGKFFLAHYYFARYYAVRVQDKKLFLKLIDAVEHASPDELKDACLVNAVMKEKCERLMEISDELFF
ncbi:MAG: hypothetical protein JRI74_05870 [Deltaproteobacteria bacterium]|nr:hypothetical protein [Deltaproteobacteria bacterium]